MEKVVFVSEDVYVDLYKQLARQFKVVLLSNNKKCYDAVAKHSDVQMINVNGNLYVDDSLTEILPAEVKKHSRVKAIKSQLGNRYPLSVPFNGKVVGTKLIHNQKYTAKEILNDPSIQQVIHVEQGYTNCSLCMLDETLGITADLGMAKKLKAQGFNILEIEKGHILLEGFDYGFIGGCIGKYYNTMYVNGDLQFHPNGHQMIMEIKERKIKLIDVKGKPLKDIGSMVFWE